MCRMQFPYHTSVTWQAVMLFWIIINVSERASSTSDKALANKNDKTINYIHTRPRKDVNVCAKTNIRIKFTKLRTRMTLSDIPVTRYTVWENSRPFCRTLAKGSLVFEISLKCIGLVKHDKRIVKQRPLLLRLDIFGQKPTTLCYSSCTFLAITVNWYLTFCRNDTERMSLFNNDFIFMGEHGAERS